MQGLSNKGLRGMQGRGGAVPHLGGAEARELGVVEEEVHALHALRLLEHRADAPARDNLW